MAAHSNGNEYDRLSKDQLVELLKVYGRLGLTLGSLWFLEAERRWTTEDAVCMDASVWRRQGELEARRLAEFLGIGDSPTLADVCRVFLLTPVWGGLGSTAEIVGDRCYLTITDCRPQRTRCRKGLENLSCKPVGMGYFEGLLSGLGRNLRFRCVFCPPDERPSGAWCRWEAWIVSDCTAAAGAEKRGKTDL
jgi:hypothetical protein